MAAPQNSSCSDRNKAILYRYPSMNRPLLSQCVNTSHRWDRSEGYLQSREVSEKRRCAFGHRLPNVGLVWRQFHRYQPLYLVDIWRWAREGVDNRFLIGKVMRFGPSARYTSMTQLSFIISNESLSKQSGIVQVVHRVACIDILHFIQSPSAYHGDTAQRFKFQDSWDKFRLKSNVKMRLLSPFQRHMSIVNCITVRHKNFGREWSHFETGERHRIPLL